MCGCVGWFAWVGAGFDCLWLSVARADFLCFTSLFAWLRLARFDVCGMVWQSSGQPGGDRERARIGQGLAAAYVVVA